VAGVELLATCAEPPQQFIRGLDCFYYRTHEQWTEPGGRVIMEAMACGVPVVAYRLGGYAEWIDHGHDGFLFDTQQQALQMIMALKQDVGLRASIGKAAREKMERMHGATARKKIVDFYLQ
jgi:glycosyltransferase involved in cell wall biosynthesis